MEIKEVLIYTAVTAVVVIGATAIYDKFIKSKLI